jgi:hypothetical protein
MFERHFTTQASLGIWQRGPPATWLFDNMIWVWLEGPAIMLGLMLPITAAIPPVAVVHVAARLLGL